MAESAETPPGKEPKASVPAEPPAAAPHPPDAPAVEDWETRFKYLLADFENFRKRTARDSKRVREWARGDLLRLLVPIFEAFEKARESVRRMPETDPVRRGFDLLHREWQAFLDAQGVDLLAKPGMLFRAEGHEAVAEAPVTPKHPEGTIVEVVQQGYRTPEGVLRPAKVVVARKPAPPAEPTKVTVTTPEPDAGTSE